MTIEPTPAPQPPPFNWVAFIGGLLLALVVGGVANIFAGLVGMQTGARAFALMAGAIPGAVLALVSFKASRNGFGQGLLVGGCIVGLLGGICGAMMVGS